MKGSVLAWRGKSISYFKKYKFLMQYAAQIAGTTTDVVYLLLYIYCI